jgi:sensor histidine kinase regulating citrate/malate metabolism
VLQTFLIKLAADDALRERFSKASEEEQRVILARDFRIGNATIAALLSGKPNRVKARLRFSDQQGTPLRRRA